MRFSKRLRSRIAALGACVLLCLTKPFLAEEGGTGDYIIGSYASILNITPNKPGFAASDLVHQVSDWCSGVAIKMGRPGATREHI
jgi:hypothetical protein